MASDFYYPTTKNAVQKTLSAQLLSTASTGDAITFDDVDGVGNTPGVLVINRINANGDPTPESREFISYTGTAGNTVLIETRDVDGSGAARTHLVGSIVEFVSDAVWAQRVIDQFKIEHNQDGTHSDITADSINLNSGGKIADNTGWIPIEETFTYASATTITIAAGGASRYQKGDKLKLTQTTVKYFYIVGVADTELTITGGSDYTLANAAITSPYLSRIENPFGFPQWFAFTPAYTNITIGAGGTSTGAFCLANGIVSLRTYFKFGSGSAVGDATLTLPIAVATYGNTLTVVGNVEMFEAGGSLYHGTMYSSGGIRVNTVSGTRIVPAALSSSVPFTWGTDDTLTIHARYQAA